MSILNRYQGFEDLELGGAVGAGEDVPGADEAVRAEIAEVQVELEQQSAEIEELKAAVEEQDEAVEEIVEVIEGMENLLGTGQFNSTAFASLYNRASKLNTKLGGVSMDRIGNESVSDAATAQIVARTGVEGFMETVKGWGEKAIATIKHIFQVIINFFVGLFSQAEKLSRRQAQLSAKLTATAKLKEKIKLGTWNVLFDYEKNGLNKDLEGWTTTQNALRGFADVAKDVSKITLASFNSAYATLTSAIKADAKKDVSAGEKSEGEKKVLVGMAGGVRVHIELKDGIAKDLKEAAEYARSVKIFFGVGDVKKLTTGEVPAKADKTALAALLTKVKSSVTALRSDKVSGAFNKAKADQVIGSLKVMKADDKEKADEVNAQIALTRALLSSASSVAQAVSKQQARVAGWSLDAVAAHL